MTADLPLDKWYDAIMGEIVAIARDGGLNERARELMAQVKRELPDRYRKADAAERRRYQELHARAVRWMDGETRP